jgi:hypothetical protein
MPFSPVIASEALSSAAIFPAEKIGISEFTRCLESQAGSERYPLSFMEGILQKMSRM